MHIATGGLLESRVAKEGTVRLTVDHAEEHYEIEVDGTYFPADFMEIHRYLKAHNFEILPEEECPAESTPSGGWRVWASHKYGEVFG